MNLPDAFGWKYVYELPFFLTKDSMLQWFQYRINHRILGTNRLMFKMGIVDKENCSFVTISQKRVCIYFGNVDILINFREL